MSRSHYATLGAEPHESTEQLRRRYLALALQLHPDKAPDAALVEAWAVLSDPLRRAEHDRALRAAERMRVADRWASEHGPDDLEEEESDEGDVFFVRCRCGGRYVVRCDALEAERRVVVDCESCSLRALLSLDPVRES